RLTDTVILDRNPQQFVTKTSRTATRLMSLREIHCVGATSTATHIMRVGTRVAHPIPAATLGASARCRGRINLIRPSPSMKNNGVNSMLSNNFLSPQRSGRNPAPQCTGIVCGIWLQRSHTIVAAVAQTVRLINHGFSFMRLIHTRLASQPGQSIQHNDRVADRSWNAICAQATRPTSTAVLEKRGRARMGALNVGSTERRGGREPLGAVQERGPTHTESDF